MHLFPKPNCLEQESQILEGCDSVLLKTQLPLVDASGGRFY